MIIWWELAKMERGQWHCRNHKLKAPDRPSFKFDIKKHNWHEFKEVQLDSCVHAASHGNLLNRKSLPKDNRTKTLTSKFSFWSTSGFKSETSCVQECKNEKDLARAVLLQTWIKVCGSTVGTSYSTNICSRWISLGIASSS